MMPDPRSGYKVFLLRLWQVDNNGQPVWRLTLQEAGASEQHHFQSIEALQTFLAGLITEQGEDGAPSAPAGNRPPLSRDLPREDHV